MKMYYTDEAKVEKACKETAEKVTEQGIKSAIVMMANAGVPKETVIEQLSQIYAFSPQQSQTYVNQFYTH